MDDLYIERWRQLLAHSPYPWVLFAHGTCVVLTEPQDDLAQQASDLLAQWPVQVGTDLGDFNIITPDDAPGWIVSCAHPDILTYLAPDEVADANAPDMLIGLQGRAKRDEDAHELHVIFIQRIV